MKTMISTPEAKDFTVELYQQENTQGTYQLASLVQTREQLFKFLGQEVFYNRLDEMKLKAAISNYSGLLESLEQDLTNIACESHVDMAQEDPECFFADLELTTSGAQEEDQPSLKAPGEMEVTTVRRCSLCGYETTEDFKFCMECGSIMKEAGQTPVVARSCIACGEAMAAQDRFCKSCGTPA